MRSVATISCLGAALVLALSTVVPAQTTVPPLLSFQGVLTDASDVATDGTESMMFALHADSTGGTALWTETQSVPVSNGVFNVLLGEVTPVPDSVFDRSEVYLAVKVGSDDWMTPRRRLASTGWAYRTGCVITIWYEDSDGDTYGDDSSTTISCTMPSGFVANNLDCNDALGAINPGATEVCDGLDNDCSLVADDGAADSDCDDGNICTTNDCSGGGCSNPPGPAGVPCDDLNLCTVGEACDAGGACTGGTEFCVPPGECYDATCNPATGNCNLPPKANGFPCTGGTCDGAGTCVPD